MQNRTVLFRWSNETGTFFIQKKIIFDPKSCCCCCCVLLLFYLRNKINWRWDLAVKWFHWNCDLSCWINTGDYLNQLWLNASSDYWLLKKCNNFDEKDSLFSISGENVCDFFFFYKSDVYGSFMAQVKFE